MQFSNICRDALIESECFIGMGCMLTNTRKIAYRRSYEDVCEPPIIRRAARIGARVTILPGVEIGENALIGAGSVVTKNVPPCWVAVGNPAILVREVGKDEII
jgi:acetyltransferase-like isoleucine patch superfamily enzyme